MYTEMLLLFCAIQLRSGGRDETSREPLVHVQSKLRRVSAKANAAWKITTASTSNVRKTCTGAPSEMRVLDPSQMYASFNTLGGHTSRQVGSCHQSPQHDASSGCGWRNGLQIWRVAANTLNKQSRTADNGWSSSLGVGQGANNSSP